MSWILALYTWGVAASSIVNTTNSLLALWYAKTEDKDYYEKFKKKSEDAKIAFFAKNILKTFIPVYNIIHPIFMVLNSKLISIFHPIKSLKNSGKSFLDEWKRQEAKNESTKEKIKNKFNKISNWFNKTKDNIRTERDEMLEERRQRNTETSSRTSTSEQRTYTLSELNERINSVRSEYSELMKKYNSLENSSEKRKVALRINKLVDEYNDLEKQSKELKNKQSKTSTSVITERTATNTRRENTVSNSERVIKDIDTNMALLKDEYNKLKRQYNSLKASGASQTELNTVLRKAQRVATEYNELNARRKSLVINKPVVQNNRTSRNNDLAVTVDSLDNEIQNLMNEKTRLERLYVKSIADGASKKTADAIISQKEDTEKRISYLISYRRNLIEESQPTSGGMTLRR